MECFAVAQVWALHKQIGGIVANEPVEVRISRRFQLPKLSAGIPPAEQARETLQLSLSLFLYSLLSINPIPSQQVIISLPHPKQTDSWCGPLPPPFPFCPNFSETRVYNERRKLPKRQA